MNEICIIPCGNKKIWSKQPNRQEVRAEEAYIGTFHRLCKTYAKHFFDDFVILSAKHGFLHPDDFVDGPYDVSFSMKTNEVITNDELIRQVRNKGLDSYDRFVVLTGKKYVPILDHTLQKEAELIFPLLTSSGIGIMQRELKQAVHFDTPLRSNPIMRRPIT
ncbi:DUF6884 domain-containing protein [Salipaludibacillus daqingensis]|uniref:DUF6884 domain-containing protein n=1 Tax=Salipaludibacillus daqingensis TaxID=3041001 RepID=UPI002475ECC1|nr:DUF6884 domain-containing protein [Salipaludibacillus daqingensis]